MSLSPDTYLVLGIEKPVAGGRMLARHEGQVVFVLGAIPGERVRARVERVSSQLAHAVAVDIIEPSADRRAEHGDLLCGGSVYAHIAYERQLSLKAELARDAFARIAKMSLSGPLEVMPSPEEGYRARARLHIHEGRAGFFREGTHDLCDVGSTRQLLPAAVEAVRRLERAMATRGAASSVVAFEIAENVAGDERVVSVQLNRDHAALEGLAPIEGLTGVEPAGYGSPYVSDAIELPAGVVRLRHHVRSFFQSNRFLLSGLTAQVVAQVAADPVVDLYAGVGLFSVALAAMGRTGIVSVEGDRFGAGDLLANAAIYPGAVTARHAAVESFLEDRMPSTPGTLLLDPPRTGVSSEALAGIIALKPPRVVYVSCDLATLARDTRRFVEAGYRLEHIEAFDLFPNTAHVETLAVLVR